jgi:LuxR family maltose regulon positive regulatory protein
VWVIQALLLVAIPRGALRDSGAASRALERALDAAEVEGVPLRFLLQPAPELLERHSRFRTTHAALISEILNPPSGHARVARPKDGEPGPPSASELREPRYVPSTSADRRSRPNCSSC